MYKAEIVTADLEENTMTFEIEGDMIVKAGEYVILTKEEYGALESQQQAKEEGEKAKALKAITALRQLSGLNVISGDEYSSIKKKVMDKYGDNLSPIRATLD